MVVIRPNFKPIRLAALMQWYKGLERNREEGEGSDFYGDSLMCRIQDSCTTNGSHCSFICSLGDWLNNVSDMLHDTRFDGSTYKNADVLFRYYTRILLVVSEIIEDFVNLHKQVTGKRKNEAGTDLELDILQQGELANLSNFINSICKHKTENQNFHVHNHHLELTFEDFGFQSAPNQIKLGGPVNAPINRGATILMPRLSRIIHITVAVYQKVLHLIANDGNYRKAVFEQYNDPWTVD